MLPISNERPKVVQSWLADAWRADSWCTFPIEKGQMWFNFVRYSCGAYLQNKNRIVPYCCARVVTYQFHNDNRGESVHRNFTAQKNNCNVRPGYIMLLLNLCFLSCAHEIVKLTVSNKMKTDKTWITGFVDAMLSMLGSASFTGLLPINLSVAGKVTAMEKLQGRPGSSLANDAARAGVCLLVDSATPLLRGQ